MVFQASFFSIELLSRDLKELIGERTAAKISSSSSGPNNRRKKLGRHALTELNLAQLQGSNSTKKFRLGLKNH